MTINTESSLIIDIYASMPTLFHQIHIHAARQCPNSTAISHKNKTWSYKDLDQLVQHQSNAFKSVNLKFQSRVGIYLPKQIEAVSSFLSITQSGGIAVPINPVLKAPQVLHIINDCSLQILITTKTRLQTLSQILSACPSLLTIIIVENEISNVDEFPQQLITWKTFLTSNVTSKTKATVIDTDVAVILYTSGSTGKAKGVILSHRNLIAGIKSVSSYLNLSEQDKLLAVLPFSFDYGLNQLTTALYNGACCILQDYLLPSDVIKAISQYKITGLAAVPSLFAQIAPLDWPKSISKHLRYLTNSGGKLAPSLVNTLQKKLPDCQLYLMYGLTEAFRSTYLPPDQVTIRPDAIGKPIPNAKLFIVGNDGALCAANEPGELVHSGSLVTLGYWNNPEETSRCFKPPPNQTDEIPIIEMAVWSGDIVRYDEDGYLYFIGRNDEMIKTSGYRVSPTEIEDEVYASGLVEEAAAIGVKHKTLGQSIWLIVSTKNNAELDQPKLMAHCKASLANYMIPEKIMVLPQLPKNSNGKIDRLTLTQSLINE